MGNAVIAKTIQIERPGPPAIVQELAPVVREARSFCVSDVVSHATALERIRTLRNGERAITDYFEPSRKAADAAKKEILTARDGLIGPFAEARSIYDRQAQAYEAEEHRKAEQETLRLQEKARQEEEERMLALAQQAQDSGHPEEAEAILNEDLAVPIVTVAPAVAEVPGVSSRIIWSAEVYDFMALVKYVASHPDWESLLEPSMPNLNRLAVAQRNVLSMPGVRAVSKVVRGARG